MARRDLFRQATQATSLYAGSRALHAAPGTQRARILSGDNVVLTRNALPLARQTPSRPYLWMISDQQTRFMAFPEIGDERYSMYAQPSA